MPTLILTPRYTEDSQALWRAAIQHGWNVERLAGWRVPDELFSIDEPVLYVESLFGPMLASQFDLRLIEPPIDWLPRLPEEFRKRRIELMKFRDTRVLTNPTFIKPPNDKSFPARIYTGSELPDGYDDDTPVLAAEIVTWELEFRSFILNRELQTLSLSLRNGELQREQEFFATAAELAAAETFLHGILADSRIELPRAAVLDVGVIPERGWAIVEQNSAWGSGLYGCDPVKVLNTIRHAALPIGARSPAW